MKLVTFTFNGTTSIGAINGDHIVDFSDSSLPNNMIDFIALGDQGLDTAKNLIDKSENKIDRFALEENIDSIILSVDSKSRTLNLSIKELEIQDEKEALSKYGSSTSGASLGDILGSVLKK